MDISQAHGPKERRQWGLVGAIVSAIAVSICCLGPLLLLVLGVGGVWMVSFSGLEPYRPIFMTAAVILLGMSFYKVYGKPKKGCAADSCCANPEAERVKKITLWVAAVLVVGLFAFPYTVPYLSADSTTKRPVPTQAELSKVTLDVRNLTCAACTVIVTQSLKNLDGVIDARVSFQPPQAVVVFDPSKVNVERILAATANSGYPSQPMEEKDQ